jgi:hypothetical protein
MSFAPDHFLDTFSDWSMLNRGAPIFWANRLFTFTGSCRIWGRRFCRRLIFRTTGLDKLLPDGLLVTVKKPRYWQSNNWRKPAFAGHETRHAVPA